MQNQDVINGSLLIDKFVVAMKEEMDNRNFLTKWDKFITELDDGKCLCEGGCVEGLEELDCKNCHHTYSMFVWRMILEEYLDIISKANKNRKPIRQRTIVRKLIRKYKLQDISMEDFKICIENLYDMCYTGNGDEPYNVFR